MKPAVSIVIPVYNAAATLGSCLGSVMEQDFRDFEVVLIDDGSTDDSAAIIRESQKSDSRIKLYRTSHRGIVPALNYGIRMAEAPLIARMDGDDTLPENRISAQKGHLDQHPDTGLVSGHVAFSGDRQRNRGYALYVDWINTLNTHELISLYRFVESPLAHPSVMFRKELVHAYGGYLDGPFPEDYELWLRWLERGVRMEKVDATVLYWNDHPQRLSRVHHRYSFLNFYKIKTPYLADWLKANNPFHPNVTVWGSGRTTRKRAAMLETSGVHIEAYIDIDPKKIGKYIAGKPVLSPDDIKTNDRRFVVSYVGSRNARLLIASELEAKGFINGRDFIFAA